MRHIFTTTAMDVNSRFAAVPSVRTLYSKDPKNNSRYFTILRDASLNHRDGCRNEIAVFHDETALEYQLLICPTQRHASCRTLVNKMSADENNKSMGKITSSELEPVSDEPNTVDWWRPLSARGSSVLFWRLRLSLWPFILIRVLFG